jgi:hypothetical protein
MQSISAMDVEATCGMNRDPVARNIPWLFRIITPVASIPSLAIKAASTFTLTKVPFGFNQLFFSRL